MAKKDSSKTRSDSQTTPVKASVLEKYLAIGFIASVIASVLAILVILFSSFSGADSVPAGLGMVPILVMPFGFVCLMALLVASALSRKRSNRNN